MRLGIYRLALLLLALFLSAWTDCHVGGGGDDEEPPPPPPPTSSDLIWFDPIAGQLTAEAGCFHGGANRCRPSHEGIDIAAGKGSYIRAAAEGRIKSMGEDPAVRGKWVDVEHIAPDGTVYISSYWHLNNYAGWVKPNVKAWTTAILAYSGDSGNAAGHPHLHFSLRRNGQLVNPLSYLPLSHISNPTDSRCGETSCVRDCPCFNPQNSVCRSCTSGPAPGVSSSGSGGQESMPLWMWGEGLRKALRPEPAERFPVPPLWKWANGPWGLPGERSGTAEASYEIALADVLPPAPSGLGRVLTVPRDVLGNSNALETMGADYVDPATGELRAAVVVFRTVGAAYAHDYGICSRFKAGRLVRVEPITVAEEIGRSSPAYFWGARMDMSPTQREYATVFAVYVAENERSFAVESHWLSGQYPPAVSGSILTFQVWSTEPQKTGELAWAVLQALAARGQIEFRNTAAPPGPRTFVNQAVYRGGAAELTLRNSGTSAENLKVTAIAWRAANPDSEARFTFSPTVAPGISVVRLPMPGILNAVVYLEDGGGFIDALYLADGHWFAFDDTAGRGSAVQLETKACAEPQGLGTADRTVSGCAQIRGRVGSGGFLGLGRGLDPPGRTAEDVSPYGALTFHARGDGKSYQVALETWKVRSLASTDYHRVAFTAPPAWRQIVIPFSVFRQRGVDPAKLVDLTGEDVQVISWTALGQPLPSVHLEVDRVAFTRSTIIRETTRLLDTSRIRGSYAVTSRVTDDIALRSVDLLYSTDGGKTFHRVAMAAAGGDLVRGSIPAQRLETGVRYYVEATDHDGNVATDPVNAPVSAYRFQVSQRPALWVDDFADTDPANLLHREAWTFRREPDAAADAYYENGAVRLVWDVSATGSFAGYTEPLSMESLSRATALRFLVRGARGGERVKVGVHEEPGREHKVSLGEYLPRGVTTSWQTVTVPLAAFGTIVDWSRVDRLIVAFENGFGSDRGTLFLDDLRFEHLSFSVPVVIDNYNEPTGENGVGGTLSLQRGGNASISAVYDPSQRIGNTGAAYRISYRQIQGSSWATASSDLRDLDGSRFQRLSLSVKGARGGERPHLYLESRKGSVVKRAFVDLQSYGRVGKTWKKFSIPLTAFASQGVDLAHLTSFQVVFEHGEGNGTVYLDEVQLTRP